ncbi:MAG: DNA polymerase III subunit alpha [Deltaproteobacteria bacterium]|nr:DNA polymerase III subunit alpha [Deltaproteobacteria bacterium]
MPHIPPVNHAQNDNQNVQDPKAELGAGRGFVELCIRTAFSGLSVDGVVAGTTDGHAARAWPGAARPHEVAEKAVALEFDTFAITDVNTIAGVVRGFTRAKELGIRVVVGVELWLPEGPLVLHVATAQGYTHLCEVLTVGRQFVDVTGEVIWLDKGETLFQMKDLLSRAEGLWATILPPFDISKINELKAVFAERLSVGVFVHKTPEDLVRLKWAQHIRDEWQIPWVATSRAMLTDRSQKRLHDVLTCIRQGIVLADAKQRLLPNAEAVFRSADEMKVLFAAYPEALQRSVEIAEHCRFELGNLKYAFPSETGEESPQERLRKLSYEGACRRYEVQDASLLPGDVKKQMEHELQLIAELEVAPYFLTVHEIVEIARERKILCQGRGSAANSTICYCLGITSIDPVRMNLLFERFLSLERGEPPDIDVDFEHERREEVIQEIYRRYGRDHAALIATCVSFRGKSTLHEVGKVFGLTETITAKLSGQMWHSSLSELTREEGEERLKELGINTQAVLIERTFDVAKQLTGHPRHLGIHTGGFVLTREPMNTLSPVEPARMADRTILPFDKDDVEALGLFKMDVLALGMLTCIRKGLQLLEKEEGICYELATLPAEDKAVYDALCEGDSLGVFQVESRAQMSMLPRLKPKCFYDLVVQVAIIRPGPIQGGMVHPYLRRREGSERIAYPHESLRPILERTLGIPLFQEQVMKVAVVGAGYSPGEADQLRRDMAAWKKHGRLMRHRDKLISGFVKHGIDREFGERLFEQIKGFGDYGFPESHAASFAILVYASSWIKTHHPAIFACALLNSQPMGFYSPQQIVFDAQEHGVSVRPLCVNHSEWDSTLEREGKGPLVLRMGLRLCKGLAVVEGERLCEERRRDGAFSGVQEASRRADLSLKGQQSLASSGAFDDVHTHRRAALWSAMVKPLPLLAREADDDVGVDLSMPSELELLQLDYAHSGVSIDDHPMRHLRSWMRSQLDEMPRYAKKVLLSCREVTSQPHGTRALVAGLVTGRQRPGTADGTCFVTLEDESGMGNVVVWGRDFDEWRLQVVTSPFLVVDGVIERNGRVIHIIAKGVIGVHAFCDFARSSRDFH